jgi:hypothetical protein
MVDQGGTTVEVDGAHRGSGSAPPVDPDAVRQAYLLHRARRRARFERHREKRRAGLRFWLVVLALISASIAVAVVIVDEIQRLFGV